jgi:hypothetical protein
VETQVDPSAIKIGSIIAAVKRQHDLPTGATQTLHEQFVGELGPRVDLKSLEGVSGGPIVGFFDEDGVTKYWVVALQSMSVGTRFILGCPVKLFGGIILEQLQRLVEDQTNSRSNS